LRPRKTLVKLRPRKTLVKPAAKFKESSTSTDGPIDLCCPITLEIFKDPVKTIHGQTYERSAIENWLLTKNTDPMTGETLKIKAVFPDDDMKLRCECST